MATADKSITFTVTSALSDLAQAFANLSAGQSASFSSGQQTLYAEADLHWQSIFHHDEAHGLIHLLGKPANADTLWKHQYYTISTGQWTTVSNGQFSNSGHIYGNSALDQSTGDVYLTTQGVLRRWRYALQAWEVLLTDIFPGSESTHKNGVAFHPNLFGSGQKGLVVTDPTRVALWRHSTGTVDQVTTVSDTGANAGAGIYFAAIDKTITGYNQNILVSAGGTVTQAGAPPIWTRGYSPVTSTTHGALVQHPSVSSKMLILEHNTDVGTQRRVWASTDGDNWTLQSFTHPFTTEALVLCTVKGGMNGIWGIGKTGTTNYSVLWKPNS